MDISLLTEKEAEMISRCFLFESAPEAVPFALQSDLCRLGDFKKGQVIFDSVDFDRSLGLLLSGAVVVKKPREYGDYVMRRLSPGGVFGAAALFSDEPYVSELTAAKPCRAVFFPQELLGGLLRKYPETAINYIRFLSGRVRYLNGKISGLVSGSAESAVAGYLLSAGANPVRCESLKELSARLNIGRSSLYRALGSLCDRGMIKKDGKSIYILDAAQLKAL